MLDKKVKVYQLFHNKRGSVPGSGGPTIIDSYFLDEEAANAFCEFYSKKYPENMYGVTQIEGEIVNTDFIVHDGVSPKV